MNDIQAEVWGKLSLKINENQKHSNILANWANLVFHLKN